MGRDHDRDHNAGAPLWSAMVSARSGGPAARLAHDERRAIRDGHAVSPPKAGLWRRLIGWLRLS